MKYQCRCDCHCKLRWQITNDEHESASIHVFTGANYDSGSQSPGCDKCKDLPEDFTFEDLCVVSPPLSCLLKQAQQFKRSAGRKPMCANAIWYSAMKPILLREVGYGAHHPIGKMNGSKAYDLACKTIL